ncbi:MAG: amidohydrolase family protein [Cyanobacteriota bacterium]
MSESVVSSIAVERVLTHPGVQPARHSLRLSWRHGQITGMEPIASQIRPSIPADTLTGAVTSVLAMPPLANAHDHGRGLPTLAFGAVDQALELWIPALRAQPQVDPYLLTAYALAKLARSGVGSVVHCHNPQGSDPESLMQEANLACRAAQEVGLRMAFVVPLSDRNRLAYSGDGQVLAGLSAQQQQAIRNIWDQPPLPVAEQVALVPAIAARCESERVSVQFGPIGPQWCSEPLLEAVAAASAAQNRRVHMHLFETRYQREWADATYPQGLLCYLDKIGLLSPRLTVAHGVWLRPDEWHLLAERGVIVSVNTSSNLRLRSGLAPLAPMLKAGIPVALGMDGMSLDDDEDALRELRLTYALHAGVGLDVAVTPAQIFAASMRHGTRAVTGLTTAGTLEVGSPADVLFLNYGSLSEDVLPDICDETDLVLGRARAEHVVGLIIGGQPVVQQGRVVGVDEAAIRTELIAQAQAASAQVYALQPLARSFQDQIRRFYAQGQHTQRPAVAQEVTQ